MTDPADRHLADHIEGRLHDLARGVTPPVVPPADDVRRGRRRLLHVRLAMAGATTGALAVVLGITSITAGDPTASEVDPASQLPSLMTPSTDRSPSAEGDNGSTGKSAADNQPPVEGGDASADPPGGDADLGAVGGAPARNNATDPGTTAAHGGTTISTGHHGPSDDPTTASPSSDPTGTPTETPSETPTETPTAPPTETPTATPTLPPTDEPKAGVPQMLRAYNNVLAEHLDPDRVHLQRYDRVLDVKQTSRAGGQLYALGSSYRWAAGRTVALLQVRVATGWDQVEWGCGAADTDWTCRAVDVATSAVSAEVAGHDGLRQVAVEHVDGQVVVLTVEKAIRSSDDALVGAAADVRLTLPGDAPVAPPTLDAETFAGAGVAALVRAGESFDRTAIDRTPEVRGDWSVDHTERGTLSWSALPTYSGAGWECLRTYRSCTDVVMFTGTVHVARLKKRLGGGWVVQYDGASYAVRVEASDPFFPKKRGFAFVTDPDWQPER